MALKRNLAANYLGQGWTALMGLIFVPVYIKYIGIEAYGLIGVFTVINAVLNQLDMGMTPTLGREMAHFTGGGTGVQFIRDLLRTIEIIAFAIVLLMSGIVAIGSNWIAIHWVTAEGLSTVSVTNAFTIMGVVAALRFAEGIYRSSIVGLQRQILFNVVNSTLATLKGVGAIAILAWISPSIQAFFLWQALMSIFAIVVLATVTYSSLPRSERKAHFSFPALRGVWKFAGGMIGISILLLLLTNVDKILLSKFLTLTEFGYYTLAASLAGALYMLISPISQAIYPRLCELHARKDDIAIAETYHKGTQLISVFAGSAAIVIILFSETFLQLWTQDNKLAANTAPLLSLLTFGYLCNGLNWMPYQTQLAYGWTSLAFKINVVAVALIIPAIILIIPYYGAVGVSCAWAVINLGYIPFDVYFMHRRILKAEKWRWYIYDLLMPLGAGATVAVLLKLVWPDSDSLISELSLLALAAVLTIGAALMAATQVRRQFVQTLRFIYNSRKSAHGY